MTHWKPAGFGTLTPHITVKDCRAALEFYPKILGAELQLVNKAPDGSIMHATLKIGDSMLMLNEEFTEQGVLGPDPERRSPVVLHLYVEDVDAWHQRALENGCEDLFPPTDMFWGARYGMFKDPFGHVWSLAKHIEDVGPEELQRRMNEAFQDFDDE